MVSYFHSTGSVLRGIAKRITNPAKITKITNGLKLLQEIRGDHPEWFNGGTHEEDTLFAIAVQVVKAEATNREELHAGVDTVRRIIYERGVPIDKKEQADFDTVMKAVRLGNELLAVGRELKDTDRRAIAEMILKSPEKSAFGLTEYDQFRRGQLVSRSAREPSHSL